MKFFKKQIDLEIYFLIEKSISLLKKTEKHEKTNRKNNKIGRKLKFTEDSYDLC